MEQGDGAIVQWWNQCGDAITKRAQRISWRAILKHMLRSSMMASIAKIMISDICNAGKCLDAWQRYLMMVSSATLCCRSPGLTYVPGLLGWPMRLTGDTAANCIIVAQPGSASSDISAGEGRVREGALQTLVLAQEDIDTSTCV
eukprot:481261-Pyramimonas_sp.AAC.2